MAMQNRRLSNLLLLLLILAALLFATSVLKAQISSEAKDVLETTGALPDMAFFSAGDLTVTAMSTDDIFAAGGDVRLNKAQADHMIVAGGDVIATEIAFRDLVVAGGDVALVSGLVADDVVAAAGDLRIDPAFKINGSAVLTAGEAAINAPVGAELRAAAGRLRLNANVASDAHLVGDSVVIGPGVTIGGDLRYRAQTFTMDPSVVISGKVIELEPATTPDMERWGVKVAAAFALFALAFLIGLAILVIVVALSLPGLMNGSADMIRTKPLKTLGLGFIIVAAAPIVVAILFSTVVGVPLALMIGALYVAAAPLAIAAFVYFTGMSARRLMSKPGGDLPRAASRAAWTALAAGALIILGLIPIAGGLFWLIAYTIGMGAVMTRGAKALAPEA
ncbi:MAG: hypothetical protein AAGJ87_06410 [Pseudomonadota bacterium]